MLRQVEPELLDTLPAADPRAIGSRRDLQRLNFWMGQSLITGRQLQRAFPHKPPRHLLDLGGGDGRFLLSVCRRLGRPWQGIEVTIIDRHNLLASATQGAFAAAGWRVNVSEHDIFGFFKSRASGFCDVILANLVLHHFSDSTLHSIFAIAKEMTALFLAVEPRRSGLAFAFSRAVGFIGCNSVTRHDAPLSVRAGFDGNELSKLWPQDELWCLEERPAGLFSHLFVARRIVG